MSFFLHGAVLSGTTSNTFKSNRFAKYASDIAVLPLDASSIVLFLSSSFLSMAFFIIQ